MIPEFLINLCYVVYLAAFIVRDILWLRLLIMISCALAICYGLLISAHAIAAWNSVFLLINLVQAVILFVERRPTVLTEVMEDIYQFAFGVMTRKEFRRFWKTGQTKTFKDAVLCTEGSVPEALMLLCRGTADVSKGNKKIATLEPFLFIGELSFLNNTTAMADVETNGEADLRCWSHPQLKKLEAKWPLIHQKLLLVLGQGLSRKIKDRGNTIINFKPVK